MATMEAAETNPDGVPAPAGNKGLSVATGQALALTEESEAGRVNGLLKTWHELSWGRRLGVLAVFALAVAIGVAVMLWAGAPEYKPLFIDLGEDQAGEILGVLDKLQADYKIDRKSGTILVPAETVHELRLRLAAQGYPKKNESGYEILEKEPGLGVSRALEQARYQHALEGEIARSIMTLEGVKAARVHLALPKESVFVRQRKPPSASVLLQLMPDHEIRREQVQAIVHLVASSVPKLAPERVTVVDQYGHLLNSFSRDKDELSLTDKQFEYKKKVEEHLVERIETLLVPLGGRDALRTQVAADIDFTAVERTEELYNPDLPALRSEQQEQKESRQEVAQGVPGALTNQPPAAGTAPEVAQGNGEAAKTPLESQKKLVRNYELDRIVSHVRQSSGAIRRLTVAVAVDNIKVPQADGTIVTRPYTQEELNSLIALVKQAVGYDASRGDQVTVTNVAFRGSEEIALEPVPVWQQAWVWTLGKQAVALLAVLVLVFTVLRPLLRALLPPPPEPVIEAEAVVPEAPVGTENESEQQPLTLEQESEELLKLTGPQSYEKRLEFVHRLIDQDPDRVVQVIKNWIIEDGRK